MEENNEVKNNETEKNYRVIIGWRLREERLKKGFSQQELGEKIEAEPQTVKRWELGKNLPGPYCRRKLCEIFQVSMEGLFKEFLEIQCARQEGREADPSAEEKNKQLPGAEFRSVFHFNAPLPRASEFYGRRVLRMTLQTRLSQRASTSLVGQRKIGKSWLLQYLQCVVPVEFGGSYCVGYIDATEASCQTVNGLVDSTLEALKITPVKPVADPVLRLEKAIKQSQKKSVYVLCIDEFEGICTLTDFNKVLLLELRSLASQAYFCMVTASRQSLPVLLGEKLGPSSPFFNIFEKRELGPFDREEAEFFAEKKGKQAGFTVRDQEYLLESARADRDEETWYPMCLQLAGQRIEIDKRCSKYRPDDADYRQKFKEYLTMSI